MDIPTLPDAYKNVFRLPGYTLKIRCHDKEFGTMVEQYQLLAPYFIETDEVFRLIK